MSTAERLTPVLRTVLDPTPWLLEDVSVSAAGRRSVVRVVVDRDLGDVDVVTVASDPLSMDEVADATREISAALDDSDVMGSAPYTLEVSSPGVSRPLTRARHFQRNIGRLIHALGAGVDVIGRLVEAGPEDIVLDVASTKKQPGGPQRIRLADLSRADVQIEFNRPDDPTTADGEDLLEEHPDAPDTEED
jgi:ribosome maturation factor RimP